MMQSARISIITLLLAITVDMFGNGMIVVHPANASSMDHGSAMDNSANALCKATSCIQAHGICESHCVSTPITDGQTDATLVNQNTVVSIDVVRTNFSLPIREPTQKPKFQHTKPLLILRHLQTVMKKE